VLRTTILSVELALRAGEPEDVVSDTFWVSTLYYLGSTCFAHEEGSFYGAGDDHSVRNVMVLGDIADPLGTILAMFRGVAPNASLGRRLGAVGRLMNPAILDAYAKARCDTTVQIAEIIGASPRVADALRQACERWDGRGTPEHLNGEALAAPILAQAAVLRPVATIASLAHERLDGGGYHRAADGATLSRSARALAAAFRRRRSNTTWLTSMAR
jgi:hypothetical protein